MLELNKVAVGEYESPSGDAQLSISNDEGCFEKDGSLYNFEIKRDNDGNFHHVEWDLTPSDFHSIEDVILDHLEYMEEG